MLTESERGWAERRLALNIEDFWCESCGIEHCNPNEDCTLEDRMADWSDAAEFEARVAAKLAEIFDESTEIAPLCPSCPCEDDCYDGKLKCKAAILKYARLQVEEEMDS